MDPDEQQAMEDEANQQVLLNFKNVFKRNFASILP
jgi:hypothetical protein